MQSITNCPACQTQFVVTEEQLNQHNGKVRCGHCLHVFNASEHLANPEIASSLENNDAVVEIITAIEPEPVISSVVDADLLVAAKPIAEDIAPIAEQVLDASNTVTIELSAPTSETFISEVQPSNFDDLADKSKLRPKYLANKSPALLWLVFFVLIFIAIVQSVYFLRHQIAIYYPKTKSMLVQVCAQIGCSIDLPKKIEFIVIDDSDIQEDVNYSGVMRLTTTLINQAPFHQSYPNLELTLTDVEDKPKLSRIFKPIEYLPANTNNATGLAPGEEVKLKLAISTQGITVSGYRVFVTY